MTLEGDPTAGNVSVKFVNLFARSGFATPEEAVSAVESAPSVSQGIPSSQITRTYTWYPPLDTLKKKN
jgi:hypothetical protein